MLSNTRLSHSITAQPHWPIPNLRLLVDLLRVILIAVYVEPDSRPGAARPAETENDPRAIGEDDPQALKNRRKREGGDG